MELRRFRVDGIMCRSKEDDDLEDSRILHNDWQPDGTEHWLSGVIVEFRDREGEFCYIVVQDGGDEGEMICWKGGDGG